MSSTTGLDFTPEEVPLKLSAGDSVVFEIELEDVSQIPNPVWAAQVRDTAGNVQNFTCTPTATGVTATLYPAQTRELSELPPAAGSTRILGAPNIWQGRYDVQVSYDTGMNRTLIKGPISIEEDVTR